MQVRLNTQSKETLEKVWIIRVTIWDLQQEEMRCTVEAPSRIQALSDILRHLTIISFIIPSTYINDNQWPMTKCCLGEEQGSTLSSSGSMASSEFQYKDLQNGSRTHPVSGRLLQEAPNQDEGYFSDYIPPARDAVIIMPKYTLYILIGAVLIIVGTYGITAHLIKDLFHDLAGKLSALVLTSTIAFKQNHPVSSIVWCRDWKIFVSFFYYLTQTQSRFSRVIVLTL